MMACALTGPISGSASSVSRVAVLMFTICPGASLAFEAARGVPEPAGDGAAAGAAVAAVAALLAGDWAGTPAGAAAAAGWLAAVAASLLAAVLKETSFVMALILVLSRPGTFFRSAAFL